MKIGYRKVAVFYVFCSSLVPHYCNSLILRGSITKLDNYIKMRKHWFILSVVLMTILWGCNNRIVITGTVYDEKDGSPLFQALITDRRSGETVVTDKDGAFSISVEEGDSINISYVGMLSKIVPVNSKDSVHWNVGLKEYGPIIEPALQHSNSTYDGVSMSVQNLNDLAIPVDSIVLTVKKLFTWYNCLIAAGVEKFKDDEIAEDQAAEAAEAADSEATAE